jgi:hypothetical protein
MSTLFVLIENCFRFLNKFIFLFPILGLIYFFKDKKKERFILFIGLTITIGSILFQKYSRLFNIELNYFFKDIIYNFLILLGFVLVLITFFKIVKNDLFSFNLNIVSYLKKFNLFKTIYFSGLILILIGFFVVLYQLISGNTQKPFLVIKDIGFFFTIDNFILIFGIIFCLFGIFGTILKKRT